MQEGSGALSVSLGIAAVTGLGLLAFTEVRLISLLHIDFSLLFSFTVTWILIVRDFKLKISHLSI